MPHFASNFEIKKQINEQQQQNVSTIFDMCKILAQSDNLLRGDHQTPWNYNIVYVIGRGAVGCNKTEAWKDINVQSIEKKKRKETPLFISIQIIVQK